MRHIHSGYDENDQTHKALSVSHALPLPNIRTKEQ
jgi:hypothetical protein